MNLISIDKMNKVFGKKDNIGEYFYVCEQLMPCFLYRDKQCIVIAGEDQDPFFRLARELALKMNCKEPIILCVSKLSDAKYLITRQYLSEFQISLNLSSVKLPI